MDTATLNLQEVVTHYGYVFVRISSLCMIAPIFSAQFVMMRIRILIAALLSFIVGPLIPQISVADPFSLLGFILLLKQVLIGFSIGFILQCIFQVVVLGGQIIALQSGLGFATLVDPQSHNTLPMVSQFYLMAITLLFLAANGHLILIQMIVNSFHTLPINNQLAPSIDFYQIASLGKDIFSGAISIALPAIVSLLIVNLTFAIMTKSSPQMNIFTIGFPITLTGGLIIIYFTLPSMLQHADHLFETGFQFVNTVIGEQHG